MSNIIRIGKPAGHDRAVRLMSAEECIANRSKETLAELEIIYLGSKRIMEQRIQEVQATHDDKAAERLWRQVGATFGWV